MAQPTSSTEGVAHLATGLIGGYAVNKMLGRGGGLLTFAIGAVIVAYLHAQLDAPVAKAMAAAGLQF
jgi:hypothetical protein